MGRILKEIKRYIVKKVTLTKLFNKPDHILYELKLSNFWNFKKKIRVELLISGETLVLPHEYRKGTLLVKAPKDYINNIDNKGAIKLYINNKLMWIKASEEFNHYNETMLIKEKYYVVIVRKNIILQNKFSQFSFKSDESFRFDLKADYNTLEFEIADLPNQIDSNTIDFYAFQNNKVRVITAEIDKNTSSIITNNISILSNGVWQLFISVAGSLYPIELNTVVNEEFNTYNHRVEIVNNRNVLYLHFHPHFFECESVSINKDSGELAIDIQQKDQAERNSEHILLMEDIKNGEEWLYPLNQNAQTKCGTIPLDDLYQELSNKRFFVLDKSSQPTKQQFNLSSASILGSNASFENELNSQLIKFKFYKRKDFSLGLKVIKPRFKRKIMNIDAFKMNGYVKRISKFVDCSAYLYIEDRNSLEATKVLIEGGFEVDLNALNLVALKSKDKTILDIYVALINKEGEIIGKEKIKYKHSNYKKDNYYDYKVDTDSEGTQHHFLITTTPFNNLKIETFTIPSNIEVPEDTSVKDENVWLIGERYNTAQDNGIVLFEWLRKNTEIEAYYVIEGDTPEYSSRKSDPYVLEFGSQEHFNIAFKAKVLLGTHDLENLLPYKPAKGFFHFENTYRVFLQHGVLGRKNVEYHKKYYELPFDLFIVSSDPEKQEVVMDKLGYKEEDVAVTGLARFDNLVQDEEPKDILLMPTWRDWINTDEQFLESEYYAAYSNLINNTALLETLEKHNVNLNFYPHYRAQDYFQKDVSDTNERIKFIPLGTYTVQELLIKHALLITDYSSVSFDFVLMNKPVIYYHFDVKRFFRNGILRPIEDTFVGKIATTEEDLVNLIEDIISVNFQNYDMDISSILKYKDTSNSERIYETVLANLNS
ncbi:CDP-glycerol glycerophosphotransferase family protein [Virgibacillus flavescens]|uniref:CDP-glycerol glycerophosphotransferase family protein n=1 Tax=Virgibacillus flavescens TaxID=1611422 RepID=UPI003D33BE61